MKKIFILMFSVVVGLSLSAQMLAAPPTMDPKTKREYLASFKSALEKNNVGLVKEMAKTFKEYGIQGEGEAIIRGYQAENKSMKAQIKAEHQVLNDLRDAASKKSIKECYKLITNLEKKFMGDMLATASSAVIGGEVAQDLKSALDTVKGNYDAPQILKGNANAIKNLDALAASCTKLINSLDKAQTEVWTCGKNLETISAAFTQAAATAVTKDDSKDKDKDKDKKEVKKVVTKTPPPKVVPQVPQPIPTPPKVASKSSDPDAGKTVFKGYVSDKNGKIGLTETKDKNGNVTKVTYTTYDSKGTVTGVKTYGANGKLVSNTSASAQAAKDVSQNVIKNTIRPTPPRVTCPGNCPR
jgi:hypothetical protein